jgi:hypothetical protein
MRLLALAFAAVTLGQPLGPYSGNWTAEFQGTTYIRVALNDQGGAAHGAMSICSSIHVDGQGSIDRATEAPTSLRPMLDVRRRGDVLSFAFKDNDDVDRFELRFLDVNTAELTLLLSDEARQELAADGIPVPKPFRLAKSR